ncbi:heterokaryon incompatibility protein-domain-containing protein [Xylaria sp. FL0043]|nr:heterokaryon incompatibility protein-domain-containing protein [Xylaria sp. FL0043]
MRLIHIPSMEIREYPMGQLPPYAILSHTWGREEVSFTDFQEHGNKEPATDAYRKIRGCCARAACDGLDEVWIDTCCIDKRSSAELSEAINSMFKWYQNAAICYAYLDDVTGDTNDMDKSYPDSFPKSRWFTRGWTLQELLAPSALVFYSANWVSIGNREDLADVIAETTQIHKQFFKSRKLEEFSIAQRMSWASRRQTTRIEDQAYCLLGIFGVNMPLLYGEGDLAFMRLQQEIMKESDDHTIFVWGLSELEPSLGPDSDRKYGLLAPSPKFFAGSGNIVRSETREVHGPYAATNRGLQISLPIIDAHSATVNLIHSRNVNGVAVPDLTLTVPRGSVAILNCQSTGDDSSRVGLYIDQHREPGTYVRVNFVDSAFIPLQEARSRAKRTDLLIEMQIKSAQALMIPPTTQTNRSILIPPFHTLASDFKLNKTQSEAPWRPQLTGSLYSVMSDFSPYPSALGKQEPCILEYKDSRGNVFILVLSKRTSLDNVNTAELLAVVVENTAMGKDRAEIQAQFSDAIHNHQNGGHSGRDQHSSKGLLRIVPKVTEARHASIVTLQVRRVTLPARDNMSRLLVPRSSRPVSRKESRIPPDTDKDVSIFVSPPAD